MSDLALKGIKKSSLAKRNLQKFFSNKVAMVGFIIVMIFFMTAIFAPFLTPYEPDKIDPTMRDLGPSWEHPFGTDSTGRDIMTRIFFGGRISITIGLVASVGAALIGCVLGCLAGYYGGKIDAVIVYFCEIVATFPQIMLVMIMAALFGSGMENLIIIFMITGWMPPARMVRSKVMSIKTEPFVESYRANGVRTASIMFKHILPNTLGPIIVTITMQVANFVLQEAALSYLGVGVPPTIPTWGNIINAAKTFQIFQNYPYLFIIPGIVISLFVLGVNFFGDGLRDVFDATD